MPRSFKRRDDGHPSPFNDDWKYLRNERVQYMDRLFGAVEERNPGWVVEGLIPRGYLVLLAGKPKDGKTCLCIALAHAVSQGIPFAGMPTTKSLVLYFMCEESPDEFDLAIRPHLPQENIPDLGVAFARIAIDNAYDLSALRLRVHDLKPGLIVIDPLLAATMQADFGNSGRARNALTGLKSICRELGVAAIVVHHAKERRNRALHVAENPQLAATASLNVVLNWRKTARGRIVTLDLRGRGDFANREIRLLSTRPCHYEPFLSRGERPDESKEESVGPKDPTD